MSQASCLERPFALRALRGVLFALGLVCVAWPAAAEPLQLALVVNNTRYLHFADRGTAADGERAAALLLQAFGFLDVRSEMNTDRDTLQHLVESLALQAEPDSAVVFAYSGYARRAQGGDIVLLPPDASVQAHPGDDLNGLPLRQILTTLRHTRAKDIVVLLDMEAPAAMTPRLPACPSGGAGLLLICAGRPPSHSSDGTRVPPFLSPLLDKLALGHRSVMDALDAVEKTFTAQGWQMHHSGSVSQTALRPIQTADAQVDAGAPHAGEQTFQLGQAGTGTTLGGNGGRVSQAIQPGKPFRDCAQCPDMLMIPGGSLVSGDPPGERAPSIPAPSPHQATIPSFALMQRPVTRGEFAGFVSATRYKISDGCTTLEEGTPERRFGRNWRTPGFPQENDNHPVVCVNLADAEAYAAYLSKLSGHTYRVPSADEFEYAARGMTTTRFWWGDDAQQFCKYGNLADKALADGARENTLLARFTTRSCSDGFVFTSPVASFPANPFGLFDMLGNVWQWTTPSTCKTATIRHFTYSERDREDQEACLPTVRGGSWQTTPELARPAILEHVFPEWRDWAYGFRLARALAD